MRSTSIRSACGRTYPAGARLREMTFVIQRANENIVLSDLQVLGSLIQVLVLGVQEPEGALGTQEADSGGGGAVHPREVRQVESYAIVVQPLPGSQQRYVPPREPRFPPREHELRGTGGAGHRPTRHRERRPG